MAVYTDLSAAQIADFIADYDIGSLTSYHGIAEGVENSNFLIQTTQATFILTLYEKRVERDDLPFFVGLMQHLAQQGISCPQPVASSSGATLGELGGRPAAIVTFLPGLSVRRPTAHHCAELGRGLAQLHLAGAQFGMQRANALSVSGWRPLMEATQAQADDVAHGLAETLAQEVQLLEGLWPKALPQGVIHADLFPDNAFFLNDRLSGIIDFYFACTDFFAYDIAICLNAWCFEADGAFNITKGRALLSAYQELRPFTAEETADLPVLARGAALRFLLTRLVDWLNVPPGALVRPKDPLEYLRKLRFHQAADHARDYGLLA